MSPTNKPPGKPAPERFEAGTPNVADAIALGVACDYLDALGRDRIAAHDTALVKVAMEKLSALPGIRIIGRASAPSAAARQLCLRRVTAHDV